MAVGVRGRARVWVSMAFGRGRSKKYVRQWRRKEIITRVYLIDRVGLGFALLLLQKITKREMEMEDCCLKVKTDQSLESMKTTW